VGWYIRCPLLVGDNDDPRCADSKYSLGRGAVTAVEKR
jgi:hypothetical protein